MKRYAKNLIALVMALALTVSVVGSNAYADDIKTTSSLTTTTNPSTDQSTTKPNDTTRVPEQDTTVPGGSEGAPDDNAEGEPNEDEYVPEQSEDELNNQEQQLENDLNKTENELSNLSESDQQYMALLDKKIGYINAQLMIYDNQVVVSRGNIAAIQRDIDPLQEQIGILETEYNEAQSEYEGLNEIFKNTYDEYCARLRAFYVTGETSIINILLSSKDISQLLTRLQLISVMNERNGNFMQEVDREMDTLLEKQDGLNFRKSELDVKKLELVAKQDEQKANQDNILAKQEQITKKKIDLAEARSKFPPTEDSGQTLFYNSNEVLNLTYPVPSQHHLSLGYGHYSDGRPHRALDFPLHIGAPVVAAQKGMVLKAVDLGNRSYGRYVMIYHGTDVMGREIVTLYAHNSELLVTPGQVVSKGQQIAKGGTTGNSTGPHSHFELRVDNKLVNPMYFLS